MAFWILKSDPDSYSWEELVKDKSTSWDGVRNYQARNNLNAMKKKDIALIYHSNADKAVVGIAEITAPAYPDPTSKEDGWVAVKIKAKKKLKNPVTLDQIKKTKSLKDIALIKNSRLSVQPLTEAEFQTIIEMSNS